MVKLYVEGGGDAKLLKTACRQGFAEFLKKAGFAGRMPSIVACGSRGQAYESFQTAIANGEEAFLLVDSESGVAEVHQQGKEAWLPWAHLKIKDNWDMPKEASDIQCHLMVQCTENWFLADQQTLSAFFGQGFKVNQLPSIANGVETIAKQQVLQSLKKATESCKSKALYDKGDHSFKLLALIDASKVIKASPWAKRFIDALEKKMSALKNP